MSDYARVERAIRYLEERAEAQPDLATVARHVGLSAFHFQRLFHRWAGVTPKDFLQCLTLERAKALLDEDAPLLGVSHAVGLSGPSRLHDLFLRLDAMTPGEFKTAGRNLTIQWGVHGTPFGRAVFAVTARGLCALSFLDGDGGPKAPSARAAAEAHDALASQWPAAVLMHAPSLTDAVAKEVVARMRGEPTAPLSLLLKGSPFQVRVWEALLRLPEGRTTSYRGLAAAVGEGPNASRAVARAVATNPIAYLIPCHRVIRSTGAVSGYRWGVTRKRALLGVERARMAERGAVG